MNYEIQYDICLLLGAGSSKDISKNFGLGAQLFFEISENLNHDSELSIILNNVSSISKSTIQKFVNAIHKFKYEKKPTLPTIDEFLFEVATFPEYDSYKEEFLAIGSLSILYFILSWEKKTEKDILINGSLNESLIDYIFKFIEKNKLLDPYLDEKNTVQSSLQIVTFNYDRLIEFSLLQLAEKKGKSDLMQKWIENNVFHVYGKVGELNSIPFGMNMQDNSFEVNQYLYNSSKIKSSFTHRDTYSMYSFLKSNKSNSSINFTIGDILLNSHRIIALGFAFELSNCKYIGITNKSNTSVLCNIYTEQPQVDFSARRNEVNRIKEFIPNVEFRYSVCTTVLKEFLFDLKPGEILSF